MTFTFTMDAFPGYTYFDKTRQVLCVMQIIEDNDASASDIHSVMLHKDSEIIDEKLPDDVQEPDTGDTEDPGTGTGGGSETPPVVDGSGDDKTEDEDTTGYSI